MTRTVAVVAAHPDDEVLGCGATIARHSVAGEPVHVLIVAEGVTSRSATRNRDTTRTELSELAMNARNAHAILGSKSLELLAFPDNRLDSVDLVEVVKAVELFLGKVRPDTVYTHFPGDLNVDHRIVSEAVHVACRPIPGSTLRQLLMFEVVSSTEWSVAGPLNFCPNYFVDVATTVATKMQALAAYQSEMRAWPHARSFEAVEALAKWRGASVGLTAAEAFVLGRGII